MTIPRYRDSSEAHFYSDGETNKGVRYANRREALLQSVGHRRVHKNGPYERGWGPFYQFSDGIESVKSHSGTWKRIYGSNAGTKNFTVIPNGLATSAAFVTPASWSSQQSALQSAYTSGFKRTRPGNAVAGMGQFLVELRDIPTLPLRLLLRLKTFRALGSEYLNVQFGWRPFVNDLRKAYKTYRTLESQLAKLREENGRNITRRATLQDDKSTVTSSLYSNIPLAFADGRPATGSGFSITTTTTSTATRVWYYSNLRYYTPDIGSSQWTKRATAALFGVNPTPELLWEVLPWSWLIDWFTNVGDIISNASNNAVDNLVLNASYVMKTTETVTEVSTYSRWPSFRNVLIQWEAGDATYGYKKSTTYKMRQGGLSPFGLGTTLGGLTAYQASILAAIGASRQRLL